MPSDRAVAISLLISWSTRPLCFAHFIRLSLVQPRKFQTAGRQPASVAGRLSEDRIDSATALDPAYSVRRAW